MLPFSPVPYVSPLLTSLPFPPPTFLSSLFLSVHPSPVMPLTLFYGYRRYIVSLGFSVFQVSPVLTRFQLIT